MTVLRTELGTAGLLLFLALAPVFTLQNQYCSITKQHTLCKFPGVGPRCKTPYERGIPRADRDLIMDLHNSFRALVATGNELRGRPGPQPTASNMKQMVWDEELAATAQRLADQCKYTHDCLDCRKVSRFLTGQNLYQFSENIVRHGSDWNTAIRAWYDEVADWSPRHIDSFHFIKPLGHYTQMLWADTDRMGCGYSYFNDGKWNRKLYICNYGPAGNIITTPMYNRGQPCSACPQGTYCSKQYPGLCSESAGSSIVFPSAPRLPPPPPPTPRPTPPRVIVTYAPTTRYTTTTTTTTPRPTTTTTRPTTTTTTTTTTPAPSTKAPFIYSEIDTNELIPIENRFNFQRRRPTNEIQNNEIRNQFQHFNRNKKIPTTPRYYYETQTQPTTALTTTTTTTHRPTFSRFYVSSTPATTPRLYYTYPSTTTTTTTTTPAPTTTTRRAITFSPRIYPKRTEKEIRQNNFIPEQQITFQNQPSTINNNRIRPTSTHVLDEESIKTIARLTQPPVENVKDMNSILLFCDFDFAKCPIRFTGDSWNYTQTDTPGYGRGFEVVVPRRHVTNLYIRSIMHPQEDGNVCLSFRFINFHFSPDGSPAKSPPGTLGSDGKPLSLRVTAGTLKQKPKIVEITEESNTARDWLTAKIQFQNLKSQFLIIFQLPSNFLQDSVYLAIDDVLVTNGLCQS